MTVTDSRLLKGKLTLGSTPGTEFGCQVTNYVVEQSDGNTEDAVTTLCGDSVGGGTSEGPWHMTGTVIQDFDNPTGFQQWSYQNKGTEQAFTFTPNDKGTAPTIAGTVSVKFLGIGGDTNSRITRDFDWSIPGSPEVTWPGGAVAATGVTAGTPGAFTPAGAVVPADLAALQSAAPPVVATPATAWATGESVNLGTGSAHWDGSAYVAGLAP
jgi:hypothetical protein